MKIEIDKRTLRHFSEFCYVKITSGLKLQFSHGENKRIKSWMGWFPINKKLYKKIQRQLKKENQ